MIIRFINQDIIGDLDQGSFAGMVEMIKNESEKEWKKIKTLKLQYRQLFEDRLLYRRAKNWEAKWTHYFRNIIIVSEIFQECFHNKGKDSIEVEKILMNKIEKTTAEWNIWYNILLLETYILKFCLKYDQQLKEKSNRAVTLFIFLF